MFKVSVIIPVYNGEKFIARAIDSVLNQTLPLYEIIVINDGSKDGTQAILEQYKDKIIYKTIPNGGVSNARNVGIEMSHGDWVAFLDADDIWYPNKLQRQVACLTKFSSVGFCCCNFNICEADNKKIIDHFSKHARQVCAKFNLPLKDSFSFLIQENFVGTCSNVIVSRDVLQKAGEFNTAYRQAEDYDLWLRCAIYTEFLFMSEVLLDKDTHETNLTNNQLETCQCHERVLKNLLIQQHGLLKKRNLLGALGLALAAKSYKMGDILYNLGQHKAAFAQYWQGLKFSWAPKNIFRFLWVMTKKSLRTISGGLISKKNFKKLKSETL